MSMRVLVTGGAGFIGSHIVDAYLEQGYQVAVVDDLSTGQRHYVDPRARFYHMDLLDPRLGEVFLQERPQVVNHHAAQANVRASVRDPFRDAQVNIMGSLRLLQLCHQHGVAKVVLASSGGAAYGDPPHLPCDEEQPLRPLSPYAIAKVAVEYYLEVFRQAYSLDYTILRYGNVYGPRQNPAGEAGVIAIFSASMLKGEPVTINGDGEQSRDFVYVADVARANLLAVDKGSGQACNIGSGVATSVNQIFQHLAQLTGYTLAPRHGPALPGEVLHIYLQVDKARRELGWQPTVSLEAGLVRTMEFFRSNQ